MPAIMTTALSRKFGDFVAVRDVSLDVAEGQNFGLLGPNGAGKSTFIRMLTTLLAPSSGTAQVAGYDVVRQAGAVRRAIGVIPQALTSDPDLTAAENLHFHAKLYGLGRSARRRMVDELIDSVDLTQWRDRLVGTFSGGMRRRLEIARSLMHQPHVLFLDEPTTGLDPVSRFHMWEMIRKLKERAGVTLFLTTHYMEEADALCDRVAIFDHGIVVAAGSPAELKSRVGVAEVIHVECEPVSPEWVDALRSLPGVETVESDRAACTIYSRDRMATVGALVEAAGRLGITILSLMVKSHSLDDVFVHYTGRDVRDAVDEKRRLDVRHLYERSRS